MRITEDSVFPFKTLPELLAHQAKVFSASPALEAPSRQALSYESLWQQVLSTVNVLQAAGVRPTDRIALLLPNGPEMAVAFLAAASAASAAPLNPAYRAKELEFYFSDLRPRVVLIDSRLDTPARDLAPTYGATVIDLVHRPDAPAGIFSLQGEPDMERDDQAADVPSVDENSTSLVLHTSGTTSRPKQVPLTHANIALSAGNIAHTLELGSRDCGLNIMPLFHIHGLMAGLVAPLAAGAHVVCTTGLDPENFFNWLDTFHPTWYSAVPTMHQMILDAARSRGHRSADTPLRFIRSSSAALAPSVMDDLETMFNCPVIEAYGMTEATHQMTSNPLPPLPHKAGSVGIASGPDVAIMDEGGGLLSCGEIGEVVIRGTNVTSGYENNPKANASSYTNGWFRTGDQGRFDSDGYLFLTGRLKEIINRAGEKIAPKEVDEVLLQHSAVAQAVAFAVPHETMGENVAAAVVLKENSVATEHELRNFAAERLADYKVPNQILIVDEIPKGPTGKLQRIGLADQFDSMLKADFIAPKNRVEKQLTEIWGEMFGMDQVGIQDNFFVIGGDSIRAASMINEVEQQFKKEIPLAIFLRSPTINTIAQILQEESSSPREALVTEKVKYEKPIKDSFLSGLKNRIFQIAALYAPGFKSTRVWLHRMRGVSIGKNVSIGLSVILETAYPSLIHMGDNVSIGMRVVVIGTTTADSKYAMAMANRINQKIR